MAWPHVFATLPAGNVPASYLDDNFNAAVLGGASSTDGYLMQFSGTSGKAVKTGGLAPSSLGGQIQSTVSGASSTGTTIMPSDDTIPQITEGDQYLTVSITPTNASSTLQITVSFNFAVASPDIVTVAVFRDSGANAIGVGASFSSDALFLQCCSYSFTISAASTAATTFKVRAGPNTANTLTFNGQAGTRRYGGNYSSSIVVREILP